MKGTTCELFWQQDFFLFLVSTWAPPLRGRGSCSVRGHFIFLLELFPMLCKSFRAPGPAIMWVWFGWGLGPSDP